MQIQDLDRVTDGWVSCEYIYACPGCGRTKSIQPGKFKYFSVIRLTACPAKCFYCGREFLVIKPEK